MTQLKRNLVACTAAALCGAMGLAMAQQGESQSDRRAEAHGAGTQSDMRHSGMSDRKLTDESFVTHAAQANMAEIELSKLALEKSQNQEVRDFAQRMVQDHSKASQELQSIAQKHDIDVPQEVDAKHKKKMDELKQMSGAEFDRAYTRQMDKGHKKAVMLFSSASEAEGVNEELKAFASKTLPTLQTHDRLVADLRSATGKTRAAQAESEEDTSATQR